MTSYFYCILRKLQFQFFYFVEHISSDVISCLQKSSMYVTLAVCPPFVVFSFINVSICKVILWALTSAKNDINRLIGREIAYISMSVIIYFSDDCWCNESNSLVLCVGILFKCVWVTIGDKTKLLRNVGLMQAPTYFRHCRFKVEITCDERRHIWNDYTPHF